QTANRTGTLRVITTDTFDGAIVSAWEGPNVNSLTEMDCVQVFNGPFQQLVIPVETGDTVYVLLNGDGQARSGAYSLEFTMQPQPELANPPHHRTARHIHR